jgi:hypothetical protein
MLFKRLLISSFLSISVLSMSVTLGLFAQEEIFTQAPTKTKRASTNQLKQKEVEEIEGLMHNLMHETEAIAQAVRAALDVVRDIANDTKHSNFVRAPALELQKLLDRLRSYNLQSCVRRTQLHELQQFLKQPEKV